MLLRPWHILLIPENEWKQLNLNKNRTHYVFMICFFLSYEKKVYDSIQTDIFFVFFFVFQLKYLFQLSASHLLFISKPSFISRDWAQHMWMNVLVCCVWMLLTPCDVWTIEKNAWKKWSYTKKMSQFFSLEYNSIGIPLAFDHAYMPNELLFS